MPATANILDRTVRSMLILGCRGGEAILAAQPARDFVWEAVMAAARDQAARILRPEPGRAGGETAADASTGEAESLRAAVADETVAHRPAAKPDVPPATEQPAAAAASAAPKSGKRKFVLIGIVALL